MIVTTTPAIDGHPVEMNYGIVTGETVMGTNVFRDFFAKFRDVVGGRVASYEKEIAAARKTAMGEMVAQAESAGANAIVGVDIDYEHIGGSSQSMLFVAVSGTAVKVKT